MSDIDLRFTWWQIALFYLGFAFWPLTLIALLALIWVWRKRASRVAHIAALVALAFWAGSAGVNLLTFMARASEQHQSEADVRARRSTLAQETVIAGIHLPAGTVVTRSATEPSSDVTDVELPSVTEIHGVPAVGRVHLMDGRIDGDVTLGRAVRIAGVPCSARAPARFSLGSLVSCRLSTPSRIKGIPCDGDVDLEQGVVCVLASGYSRFGVDWRSGTKVTDYGDLVWFHVGPNAPSLRLFGALLGASSDVQFERGHIAGVDMRESPARFRGCTFDLILLQQGALSGRAVGTCTNLPQISGSAYVALPATVLQAR